MIWMERRNTLELVKKLNQTKAKNTTRKLYGVDFFCGGRECCLISFLVCKFLYIQFIIVWLWINFTDSNFLIPHNL